MAKQLDCRTAAAKTLASVINGSSLNQQLPALEARVHEQDRSLYRQLCYGVLRFYPQLSGIANQLIKKTFKAKDNDIYSLILIGIYQLRETRIPDHAALNSTVAAAKGLNKVWAKNVINGILRNYQRNQETLTEKLTLAEQTSHPQWLYERIHQHWPEQAVHIIDNNNQQAPLTLRVNQRKSTVSDYLLSLEINDIEAKTCMHSQHGIQLTHAMNVMLLPNFEEGAISVQDEAAQLSAELLNCQTGNKVLDACCAPGGKSCHLLESGDIELTAIDVDEKRLERVSENLQRLNLNANIICADVGDIDTWWDGTAFDKILFDAPCSATGVIRRNPDIKLHRTPDDIKQLSQLQLQLLHQLWTTLKPNGQLLYATCSVLPEENEQVVAAFCQQQVNAKHLRIDANWGIERAFGRQLFPQKNGHDGFFYALLTKIS